MTTITWELPIKTVSEANCSEHWTKKARRHKAQQWVVRLAFNGLKNPITLPCCVKMTRLGSRYTDSDNLLTALKFVRDEVSECLIPEKRASYVTKEGKTKAIKGRADDDPRITWQYDQEKAKKYAVRIEITF
jgi:hypothetical protein